jgi:hydrogenase expression/formation protein HypC
MCLAVPAKVVEVSGQTATVDMHGNRLDVSVMLLDDAAAGDWVLVHAGFAIQKIDAATAEETFSLLGDLAQAGAGAASP